MTSLFHTEIDDADGGPDHGREIVAARQAVERARKRLLALNADLYDGHLGIGPLTEPAPADGTADIDHAGEIAEALEEARRRSRRPFGGRAAKRVVALELAQRLAGGTIGLPAEPGSVVVDLAAIDQARTELLEAEAHLELVLGDHQHPLPRRPRPWRPVTLPST